MLVFAPILYGITASWVFSNQQVFRDRAVVSDDFNLYPYAGHNMDQFLTQLTPATVWLLAIPFMVLHLVYSRIGLNLQSKFHDTYAVLDKDFVPPCDT